MQTPLVCDFHGVLPIIKLSYTPMSSENTLYSTVRIQDSTRLIIEDSIVLVESVKTTSMEDVSTRVLEKIKNI